MSESTRNIADYFIMKLNQFSNELSFTQTMKENLPYDVNNSLKIFLILNFRVKSQLQHWNCLNEPEGIQYKNLQ